MMNFITKNRLISILSVIVLVVCWKILSLFAHSSQLIPSPEKTLETVFEVIMRDGFWPSLLSTLGRGLLGFMISLVLAFMLGVPAGLNSVFFQMLNPLLIAIRSTPVISLILLAIIWLGNEMVPVFIAILTMFPILCTNIIAGLRSVDKDLIEMGTTYKVAQSRILKEIYLPSISPFLTSGFSNAMGFGWRAVIIGEVLAQPLHGIGTQMQNAQIFLQVSEIIAWTLIAILISSLFEFIIRKTEKNFIRWR
ncbi:MAG: ABC transporter permease [Bacteroidales bacterium]|nr:ABC transporter permease [Bacteroidales bacterium]